MKETTSYPFYLFEKPILIPKTQEEAKELIIKLSDFMNENNSKREASRIRGLLIDHFQAIVTTNLDATFQLKIVSKKHLELKIIYKDGEGEFIKRLKEYNDFCRKHDIEEILAFAEKTNEKRRREIREGRKTDFMYQRKKTLSDDAFDLTFTLWQYYTPNVKNYICLTEYTDDKKGIKVTYKIGNQV